MSIPLTNVFECSSYKADLRVQMFPVFTLVCLYAVSQ